MEQPQPPLPKPPANQENLRRLRQEAAERMRREEAMPPMPAPVYGGPAPVYGGPPITRRWTLRGIVTLIVAAVAALVAGLWAFRTVAPAYGGPPVPKPTPQSQPPASPKQ